MVADSGGSTGVGVHIVQHRQVVAEFERLERPLQVSTLIELQASGQQRARGHGGLGHIGHAGAFQAGVLWAGTSVTELPDNQ